MDDLAAQMGKQCTPIAIGESQNIIVMPFLIIDLSLPPSGSAEGFSLAEKAISSASKAGCWVLLKNVHLVPQWLVQLEKKFHSLTPHTNFRLFLTMEINPKVGR